MQRRTSVAAILLLLASCSKPAASPKPSQSTHAIAPDGKIDPRAHPKEFHDSIEAAMAEIPPTQRVAFHGVYECFTKQNSKLKHPSEVNAAKIRELTHQLQAGIARPDHCIT